MIPKYTPDIAGLPPANANVPHTIFVEGITTGAVPIDSSTKMILDALKHLFMTKKRIVDSAVGALRTKLLQAD